MLYSNIIIADSISNCMAQRKDIEYSQLAFSHHINVVNNRYNRAKIEQKTKKYPSLLD